MAATSPSACEAPLCSPRDREPAGAASSPAIPITTPVDLTAVRATASATQTKNDHETFCTRSAVNGFAVNVPPVSANDRG